MKKGSWIKERWETARKQKAFYKEQFNEDISVKEFFRKPEKNPLFNKVTRYDVTFGFSENFTKNNMFSYNFSIPQDTFIVYSLKKDKEIENTILNRTKEAIALKFRGKSIDWVYNKLDNYENVSLRGIEVKELEYNELNINRLHNEITYIKDNPKINVIKKTKSKTNKNSYNLDLWLK